MVGQLQWLITLERFDIQAQVVSMSRFRAQPRQGHLERLKRIYAYVQEIIPNDIPDPLSKSVTTTTTVDTDLNHCLAPLMGHLIHTQKGKQQWKLLHMNQNL